MHHPREALQQILAATLELVSLPDNDFSWSSWDDAAHARAEIEGLIAQLQHDVLPDQLQLAVLNAVTRPLKELAMGSVWADTYLRNAAICDDVANLAWYKFNNALYKAFIANEY